MTTPKKKKSEDDGIDDVIDGIDLSEKTEMGDFADQIHRPRASGSNISEDEGSAVLVCKTIFPVLGMDANIADTFMDIAKSRKGWATEKVVEGAGGIRDTRSGGSIGGWLKDRMFSPK